MSNIIVVGPHPDDQELGMGATIALLADQGHDVLLLDASDGEPTPHGDRATRLQEAQQALAALAPSAFGGTGVPPVQGLPSPPITGQRPVPQEPSQSTGRVRRLLLDWPNRSIEHTLERRHELAGVIRAHQASILFLPYFEDAHPDHLAVTRIAEDARFDAKLTRFTPQVSASVMTQIMSGQYAGLPGVGAGGTALREIGPPIYPKWVFYYFATHLRIVPQPSFLLDVSSTIDRKMASINAYRSQFHANEKNRSVVDWVRAQATYMGSRIGARAGEAFFSKEPLGLASLTHLV